MYDTHNELAESARRQVVQRLNELLAPAIDVELQAKQAHWNVRGPNFVGLHELFDKVAAAADEHADLIAERSVRPERVHAQDSAIIGTSPGKIGTAIAQQHLRSILAFCNSPLMNSIEAYVQFEPGLISDDGEVTNEATLTFLRNFMTEFSGFVARVYTVLPRNA